MSINELKYMKDYLWVRIHSFIVKKPDGGKRNKDLLEVSVPLPLNRGPRIWPQGLTDVFEG